MKIGLVLDDTLDTPDGVQQYVLGVGAWLTGQGHDVHYLVGNTTRTDIPHVHSLARNLRVKFNGNRMSMPLPVSRRNLQRFLVAEQFDVLHVQVPYSPFMAGRLLRAAPRTTAVVGTFHILPYSRLVTLGNRALALLNRRSAKRFDRMLAVSQPAREFAHTVYGYEADVVPNPVSLAQFAGATNDVAETTIVFLGRLVERKGPLLLLQAIAALRTRQLHTGTCVVVIGGKGELLQQLERFAREHQLEDIVSFRGFVDEADKPAFLAQADIAVYPSTGGESFGIVLLEAMAAARGVVLGGNNPGYASVLGPLDENQLFDPADRVGFADKLAWYLNHPDARSRASAAQRTYVRQFDIDVVGQRLLAVYAEALQSRR